MTRYWIFIILSGLLPLLAAGFMCLVAAFPFAAGDYKGVDLCYATARKLLMCIPACMIGAHFVTIFYP